MTQGTAVVAAARLWLGTPYVHQASVRGAGADCLGLVRGVWRDLIGQEPCSLPAYSMDWGEYGQDELLWQAARKWLLPRPLLPLVPGQVLLFRMRDGAIAKHLGILSQGDSAPAFIHAYSGHGVVESPLSDPWCRRIVAMFGFPEGAL